MPTGENQDKLMEALLVTLKRMGELPGQKVNMMVEGEAHGRTLQGCTMREAAYLSPALENIQDAQWTQFPVLGLAELR